MYELVCAVADISAHVEGGVTEEGGGSMGGGC